MQQRRHFKHFLTLEERLTQQAEYLRDEARMMPMGKTREDLLKRARQAEIAADINRWLASPDHKPPDLTPEVLAKIGIRGLR
jgi:hypothetical protein